MEIPNSGSGILDPVAGKISRKPIRPRGANLPCFIKRHRLSPSLLPERGEPAAKLSSTQPT